MELRGVLRLAAAALLPAVVIAAALGGAQHAIEFQATTNPEQPAGTSSQRKLHGRFLHITDFHPDRHYKSHTSTEAGLACHRGKGPAGYYGAETSDCDTPLSLVNATFDWIAQHLKDDIDFVIWTGDSARHDSDGSVDRSEKDVVRSNRMIADKFVSTLSDSSGLTIPVIPTFGNNDILPHNIMVGGPSKWLKWYTDIWKAFVPESQRHTFEMGGWFFTEVIPNRLAVFSLNTLYFFDRNAGIDDCVHPSEPGFKQMEWLRIQLQFLRNRGMKAILMGHVPPARTSGKENWDETCWQKYTLWLQQYRDVVVGSLYGHMNIDHFFLQDTRDINLKYLEASSQDYETYLKDKRSHGKQPVLRSTGDANQKGFHIQGGADYLADLRSDWSKLPRAAIHATGDDDLQSERKNKKKRPKKDPLGGQWAERYQLSLVSPSIVPNYFPTLRVFEYNIIGMENSPTWKDVIRDSKPEQGEHVSAEVEEIDVDILKKKHRKKGKKEKKPKDPYLIVPEPPATTAPPGPAYSVQPLTLMGYTQYFANLTYLNNDAHDFVEKPDGSNKFSNINDDAQNILQESEKDELSEERWNEGVHKGKKPGHKPKPRPFQFAVEYSTFDDKLYKIKDLTVNNMIKLAYRIGQVNVRGKALAEGFDDEQQEEGMEAQDEDDEENDDQTADIDDDSTDDSGAGSGDEDGIDEASKDKKKKKKKKGKKGKKKHNKVWLHFLRHAFVSTLSEKELRKV